MPTKTALKPNRRCRRLDIGRREGRDSRQPTTTLCPSDGAAAKRPIDIRSGYVLMATMPKPLWYDPTTDPSEFRDRALEDPASLYAACWSVRGSYELTQAIMRAVDV